MTASPDTLLEFPCEYALKTFGKNTEAYQSAVLTIVRKHIPDLKENSLTERPSKDGNYLALTLTFTAENKNQLDELYQELSDNEHVVLTL